MKSNVKSIITIIALIAVVIAAVSFLNMNKEDTNPNYSEIISMLENDEITEFKVDGSYVMTYKALVKKLDDNKKPVFDDEGNPVYEVDKDGKLQEREYTFSLQSQFQLEEINTLARENYEKGGNLRDYNYEAPAETPWYISYLPFVIILLLFVGMWFFVIRQSGGGGKMNNFARSKAKVSNDKNSVKFADVAGADEEKAELVEVVEFLKDPSRFVKLGARIPRGVLLVGPPGTGKTLLAKAVAGEAGVPFFSISGSDFVEMYVGVGASRVRDLFDNARKTPASIIFIDEIDAIGINRTSSDENKEYRSALNKLLACMSEAADNNIIVICATNVKDQLDPALIREGRIDKIIKVPLPDLDSRVKMFELYINKLKHEDGISYLELAEQTEGKSGAFIAACVNHSGIYAVDHGATKTSQEHLDHVLKRMLTNREDDDDNNSGNTIGFI